MVLIFVAVSRYGAAVVFDGGPRDVSWKYETLILWYGCV